MLFKTYVQKRHHGSERNRIGNVVFPQKNGFYLTKT